MVPEATPDWPRFVAHVIATTPTLSLAVPFKVIEAADVETDVDAGETIVRLGAVVSGVAEAACRITVMEREVDVEPWIAVRVIVFDPTISGTPEIVHEDDPRAVPEMPPIDQVTTAAPDPPDVVPDRLIVDAVVVAGEIFTVRLSGPDGAGVGAGAGVGFGSAAAGAYIVCAAAMSSGERAVAI